jgi:alkylation response protein AidB-like acyl-CoA dehydrogenase
MNFEWNDEQRGFRKKIENFLVANLPDNWEAFSKHGPGSSALTEFARTFCRKLAENGMLFPHWPKEIGGDGLGPWEQQILAEVMWEWGEPRGGQYMNVNWIGPSLVKYGTEAQKARYLPQVASGEMLWCQGFSEPNSGSDLASLRTRAELLPAPAEAGGDHYRINGQKIWTSYAGMADTCFLLTRTSDDRKRGITILLVPMDTPGITVRQIPSMIGEGDIHETFFDDVIVPVGQRFGEEGQAWEIISYSLQNERLGIPRYHLARSALDRGVGILKQAGAFSADTVKADAARCAALCEAARTSIYAIIQKRVDGGLVGAEASSARFATVMAERNVSEFIVEHVPEALAGGSDYLQMHHQRGIVAGISSGSAEILLNIIATDVLALPREPR